jgi:catechol 2,3-dioxygenase-like lactoylglutathione lyase family enzyme
MGRHRAGARLLTMITIDEIRVGDSPDAWRDAGFTVDGDICVVDGIRIRLSGSLRGITDWTLHGIPAEVSEIDGVPTAASSAEPGEPSNHANGVTGIDHVVLMTPDLSRTTAALNVLGLQVRRERDARPFRQAFLKLGGVILEVVGPQEPGPGATHLWGLTFCVDDLDATAEFLGDRIGRVKDAVQPGRRIATLRGEPIGISPAVAFMSRRRSEPTSC